MGEEAAIRVRGGNRDAAITTAWAKWPFLLQLVAAGSCLRSSFHLLLTSTPPITHWDASTAGK